MSISETGIITKNHNCSGHVTCKLKSDPTIFKKFYIMCCDTIEFEARTTNGLSMYFPGGNYGGTYSYTKPYRTVNRNGVTHGVYKAILDFEFEEISFEGSYPDSLSYTVGNYLTVLLSGDFSKFTNQDKLFLFSPNI